MEFPVDVLASVSQEALEKTAQDYMNGLLYVNPDSPQLLTLDNSTQVPIGLPNVGFVPLYGVNNKQKVLALFSPGDQFTAVGLYLLDRWWTIEDILKTSDPSRDGAVEVETIGERIVLYILNRVVYRAKEMSTDEPPFLCHEDSDYAKIFWKHGEAVGFYSVKPSGSLCRNFLTQRYQLPVMDSIFVRKCHRGNSFGLQMLENFVDSFKEDSLGLRYPISKTMYKVCAKYLSLYPADKDLFWEVESVGGPSQRTNIANKIQAMDLSALSKNLSFSEQSSLNREMTENNVVIEEMSTCIQGRESMKCTVEIVEEMNLMSHANVAKDIDETPVTARGRSSGLKRRKIREETAVSDESKSEKVIRIEDIEAEVDTPKEESVIGKQQGKKTEEMESGVTDGQSVLDLNKEEAAGDAVATAIEGSEEKEMEDRSSLGESEKTVTATTIVTPEGGQELSLKLQRATVVLVDVNRTTCQTQVEVENVASEMLQISENEGAVEVAGPEVVKDMDKTFEEEKREITTEEEIQGEESKMEEPKIEEKNRRNSSHRSSRLPKKTVDVQAEFDVRTPRKSSRSAAKALEAPQERSLVTTTKEVKEIVRRKSQRHQNVAVEEEQRKEANETPKSKTRQPSKSLKTEIEGEKAEQLIQKRVLRGRTSVIAKQTPGKYTRSQPVETINEQEVVCTVEGREEEKVEEVETTTKGKQDEIEEPALEEKEAEQDRVQSVVLKGENEGQQEETVVQEKDDKKQIEHGEPMDTDKSAPENRDQMKTENQGEKTDMEITAEKDSLPNQTEETEHTPEPAIGDKVGEIDQIEVKADNLKEDAEKIVPVGQEGAIDSNKLVEEERPPVVQRKGLGGRAKATKATPKRKSTQQSNKVQLQQEEPEHEEEQKVVEENVTEHREEHALVTEKPTHEEESKDKEAKETTAKKDTENFASATGDKIVEEQNDTEEKLEEKTTPEEKQIVAVAVEERDLTEKESMEKVEEETEDFEGKPEDEEDENMLEKKTVVEESAAEVEVENMEPYNDAMGIVEGVVDEVIKNTSEELLEVAEEPTVEEVIEKNLLDEVLERAVEEKAGVEEEPKGVEKEEPEPVAEMVEEAIAETAEIQEEPKLEEQKEVEPVDDAVEKLTEKKADEQISPPKVEEVEISEEEEEPPAVKTRALRRGRKSGKATPKRKSTQRGKKLDIHEEEIEAAAEESADEEEEAPVIEIRVLRRGRKPAPVTPRRKSNRAHKQQQEDEEEEETVKQEAATAKEEDVKNEGDSVKHDLTREKAMAAEENQVNEEEMLEGEKRKEEAVVVGEERVDVAKSVPEVDEEEKIEEAAAETAQFRVEKLGEDTNVEGNSEVQITSDSKEIEKEVGISEEDNQERNKTGAKEIEEKIVEKDEKDVIIAQNTPGDGMEQDIEETPVNKEIEEEEAPVVDTRTLGSKSKAGHVTPAQKCKIQGPQEELEEPAEEEKQKDRVTKENTEKVEDSVEENTEEIEPEEDDVVIIEEPQEEANKPETILAEEQGVETEVKDPEETSEIAEAEEEDDKVQEKAAEEEAAESEEPVEEVKPPEVETRALRSKTKTTAAMSGCKSKRHSSEEDKEEVEPPKRRSTRRRPSVDYNEQVGEEEEASGIEPEEEEESKKVVEEEINVEEKEVAESEADEETEKLGEKAADEVEENIRETSMEAEAEDGVEDKITLELEEEEEDKEEENTSEEEEVEAPVVGKRNLRGRSIATPIAAPQCKSARRSKAVTQKYKVESDEPEEVSSEEDPEQSPRSVTKRRLRKRKSTEPTPIRRSKRRSRT